MQARHFPACQSMYISPNLFSYAANELSQDAFICWLIKWSENARDPELRNLGHRFVNALISKWEAPKIKNVSKVEVERQKNRIDVLACINDRHVLLIEDKTFTGKKSGNQLNEYRQAVIDGLKDGKSIVSLKTGNRERISIQGLIGMIFWKCWRVTRATMQSFVIFDNI